MVASTIHNPHCGCRRCLVEKEIKRLMNVGKILMGCGNTNPDIHCRNISCDYCRIVADINSLPNEIDKQTGSNKKLSVSDFKLWFDGYYEASAQRGEGFNTAQVELLKNKISELE